MANKEHHSATHGKSDTKLYDVWSAMMNRCYNAKNPAYHMYGGRGVAVCERWHSVVNFMADMEEPGAGLSLDRFPNNDGNYEPGNVRWATAKEQAANRRPPRKHVPMVPSVTSRLNLPMLEPLVAGKQGPIALSMGTSQACLSRILRGHTPDPRISTVAALARALGKKPWQILSEEILTK